MEALEFLLQNGLLTGLGENDEELKKIIIDLLEKSKFKILRTLIEHDIRPKKPIKCHKDNGQDIIVNLFRNSCEEDCYDITRIILLLIKKNMLDIGSYGAILLDIAVENQNQLLIDFCIDDLNIPVQELSFDVFIKIFPHNDYANSIAKTLLCKHGYDPVTKCKSEDFSYLVGSDKSGASGEKLALFLLDKGYNANKCSQEAFKQAMHHSMRLNQIELISALINHGYDFTPIPVVDFLNSVFTSSMRISLDKP